MSESDRLAALAHSTGEKNVVDAEVARLLNKPALPGHFGEFVASRVFDIELHPNAAHPGSDGVFRGGELEGKSVNIKYYPKHDRLLDMNREGEAGPDYYLVMTGPEEVAGPSFGKTRPWVIESVFLFDATDLVFKLRERSSKKKIGVATYVPADLWREARIYWNAEPRLLKVTETRRRRLALFAAGAVG